MEAIEPMEPKDLITVIIPCYNSKDHLKTSIPSVLNQTYGEFELLLVDDHSSDQYTLDLLHDFARQDPRIKLLCNESNMGVSSSRNKAVASAKGKYVTFLDHDDKLRPNFLAKMYEALELTQTNLAWCHVYSYQEADSALICHPKGLYIPQSFFDLANKVSEDSYLLEREALLNDPLFLFMPILPMGKMINLEAYRQANLYFRDCYSAEDQDWCLRLFCEFSSYVLLDCACADHLIAEGSLSHSSGEKVCEGLINAMQERYKALVQYDLFNRLVNAHMFQTLAFFKATESRFEPQLRKKYLQKVFALLTEQGYSLDVLLSALSIMKKQS